MAGAEGFERSQQFSPGPRQVALVALLQHIGRRENFMGGQEILERREAVPLEKAAELLQVIRRDLDAGGDPVASPGQQQAFQARRHDGRAEVEALGAPAGALPVTVCMPSANDRRAAEALPHAAGHDADDAGMPLLVTEEQHLSPGIAAQEIRGHGVGLLLRRLLQVAPALVCFLAMLRQRTGGLQVAGPQQTHRVIRILEAPSSIQAGTPEKTERARIHRTGADQVVQGAQPGQLAQGLAVIGPLQRALDQGPVDAQQRHDIGDRPETGQKERSRG